MSARVSHFPGWPVAAAVTPPPVHQPDTRTDDLDIPRGVVVGVGWAAVAMSVLGSAGFLVWRLAVALWAWL